MINRKQIAQAVVMAGLLGIWGAESLWHRNAASTFADAGKAQKTVYISEADARTLEHRIPNLARLESAQAGGRIGERGIGVADAEAELMRAVQEEVPAEVRTRAEADDRVDPLWDFAAVLGPGFNAQDCPHIARFMARADGDVNTVSAEALTTINGAAPAASGTAKGTLSPSGHAARAFARARLLSEIAPEHTAALFQLARSMALNRMVLGRHGPSECVGGIVIGSAVADSIVTAARNGASAAQTDLRDARDEWSTRHAAGQPNTGPALAGLDARGF